MQQTDRIARARITIAAPREKIWRALVNPVSIKRYMFGTTVRSDWREGSAITWSGEWDGRPYEDKGTIVTLHKDKVLAYTHFSGRSGKPDRPENYHTVRITLTTEGDQTEVILSQDNNQDDEERAHSENNWVMMLMALKRFVEVLPEPSPAR
jgi:uncharacterized protein YndB with AHSA1/START domain